ncbi:hypothetical protein B0H14DRAFT_3481304 [Mycena olivaceomarginata]|nr:hypothetical protein B0H14DRAFT_3481304 [Mycena olivaceomarginata]
MPSLPLFLPIPPSLAPPFPSLPVPSRPVSSHCSLLAPHAIAHCIVVQAHTELIFPSDVKPALYTPSTPCMRFPLLFSPISCLPRLSLSLLPYSVAPSIAPVCHTSPPATTHPTIVPSLPGSLPRGKYISK